MERITRTRYFMAMAELASKRSTCVRRQVGAVAVVNDRIVATGYNGPPSGMEHCTQETCVRVLNNITSGTQLEFCRALHAEANLLVQCATSGASMDRATIYCTHTPCTSCIKLLIGVGMKMLICKEWYPDEYTKELLQLAGFIPKKDFSRYGKFVRDGMCDPLPTPVDYEDYIVYAKVSTDVVQKLYHVPA